MSDDTPIESINGVSLEDIPVYGPDTGIPIKVLAGRCWRSKPNDPRGAFYDQNVMVVYPDWRLCRMQAEFGVELWPELHEFVVVPIKATSQGA